MTIEIIGSQVGRTVDVWRAYKQFLATFTGDCNFCENPEDQTVETHRTMLVLRNIFPYAIWDGLPVEEHLMVVPVRHALSLDEYTDAEVLDFFALVRRYEAAGYSIYSRAPGNTSRTVGHVHTHLIKTGEAHGELAAPAAA